MKTEEEIRDVLDKHESGLDEDWSHVYKMPMIKIEALRTVLKWILNESSHKSNETVIK